MSFNILSDNELDDLQDCDASVSSNNSDSEKVDCGLIKKILSEMKSEFTRGTSGSPSDTVEKFDSSDEAVPIDDKENVQVDIQKLIEQNLNSIESCDDNSSTPPEEPSTNHIIINNTVFEPQETGDEEKPRIILTLRTSEEDRECGSRSDKKSNHILYHTLKNESISNEHKCDEKPSQDESRQPEGRTRRSLRSQTVVKDETENRGKRTSRRFSKENGRESVLQNAIARKEKSFNSLNQAEDKCYRRGARSPRQCVNEKPVKGCRTKSPKAQGVTCQKQSNCDNFEINGTEADVKPKIECNTLNNETNCVEVKCEVDEIKSEAAVISKDNPNLFTKTGKRRPRYRYFKGLKYSLTGGSVRKKALKVARKKKLNSTEAPENSASLSEVPGPEESVSASSSHDISYSHQPLQNTLSESGVIDNANVNSTCSIEEVELKEEVEEIVTETNIEYTGVSVSESIVDSDQESIEETEEEICIKNESEPIAINEQFFIGVKRKLLCNEDKVKTDMEDGDEKRCRQDAASPDTAEGGLEPDNPESTAIMYGVGSAGICLCNKRVELFANANSFSTELYCQAVDSLDERLIGCCNTVDKENARLVRPSMRVPYIVLCDVHHQRLQRHNCCPGCGNFCTQGKFVQCALNHHYHSDCRLVDDDKTMCPHCGSDSETNINISLGAHKYPVFLPLQKPLKNMPSAKMTLNGCKDLPQSTDNDKVPLVPPSALILPSGLQITSQGLPPSLEKDKLEHLLHVACSIRSEFHPRYSIRNMYQAAKCGDAEKIVYILASGLNPNHQFREWNMASALHVAAAGGHLSVVHLLVQAGANTDLLDRDQSTPLMLACNNEHNDVVKYLVKAGASVTLKGGDGMTALHLAAKSGNLEACYYLISNPNTPRTFIDSLDDGRWTPLVWAAEHKHTHVVKFLLEKRADPLVRDAEQNIALHWAALAGSVDISEALLNYGSDVNSTNAHADTPLHIAARQNVYACVLLLLARGARVDMRNRTGFLPLDCCLVNPSDTYTAIKLNVELRARMNNMQNHSLRILTNDITRGHEANPIQCVNSVDDESEPQDFVYISENCFTSNINIDRTISSLQSCKCRDVCGGGSCVCGKISIRCWYDDEGKLLPEFNFADPPMLFECNPACLCNRLTCKNRVVQHGITARFQLFRTKDNKGWGVSTLRLIPKGSYVCEYIGEIISDCEADTREDDSYLFDLDNRDGETYCIDARRYGNIARFINHSCVPNLLPVRVFINHQDLHFPRIAFFANRDIEADEELGFDYGEKFWIIKCKLFTCTCGAENCRYSESTIEQTLEAYNMKLRQEMDNSH